jgi:hypothetical protein
LSILCVGAAVLVGAALPVAAVQAAPWSGAKAAVVSPPAPKSSDATTSGNASSAATSSANHSPVHPVKTTAAQTSPSQPAKTSTNGTSAPKLRAGATTVSWVSACGQRLCVNGTPWRLTMGSINGKSDPADAVRRAKDLGLNAIRLTDFLDKHASPATGPYDASRWADVDKVIAASGAAGLHVELDLATYRNLLATSGVNPYTADWRPFLDFVVNRRNSVTRIRYGDDPTIALVSFAGEVEPINSATNTRQVTTQQLTDFYRGVLAYWSAAAPRQLLSAGGLMHLGWNSGIDWKAIFALPHNDVIALHLYSDSDRQKVVPAVAAYGAQLGRPWITEEFGFLSSMGDAVRAAKFAGTYQLNRAHGSAGTGFWNLGPQTSNTHDVGPQFPAASAAVRREASTP